MSSHTGCIHACCAQPPMRAHPAGLQRQRQRPRQLLQQLQPSLRQPRLHQHRGSIVRAAAVGSSSSSAGSSSGGGSSSAVASTCFLGQRVPALGLGLAALGRPGYINLGHAGDLAGTDVDAMRQQCWDVLDVAWSLGVRYFDAARSYGRAEEFLGGWLRARGLAGTDAAPLLVGSKWGYAYTAGWRVDTGGTPHEVKEHTAAQLGRQAAETAEHLGPWLRLYQIHSATLESGVLANAEVLRALGQLKRQRGWALGLSVSGVQQAEVIQQALQAADPATGERLFSSVQATYNMLEQSAGPALCEAAAAGLCVIVKEAMANGRLLPGRNASPHAQQRLHVLQQAAQQHGTTPDALALACVMRQPFAPMVLSGAASVAQLRSNSAALALAQSLPDDAVVQLQAALVMAPHKYWDERAQLAWN